MTETYVFAYPGGDGSQCYLIRADSEMEALGLLVHKRGMKPTGEIIGTVDEVTDENTVTKVI